jgi:predicted enzyme related to lactoylglutathione lyase
MSSTQASNDPSTEASGAAATPMRFEVTLLPVADDDRAKAFYERLGWRLDADFPIDGNSWLLQELTERLPGRV